MDKPTDKTADKTAYKSAYKTADKTADKWADEMDKKIDKGDKRIDKITLRGMRIYGFHGVYPIENQVGRYFEIDAELFLSLERAAEEDDLGLSVNYAQVFDFVKVQFTKEAYRLIETAAVRLADALLAEFPIEKVIIRVRKPNPPVDGCMDYAEAQVERSR